MNGVKEIVNSADKGKSGLSAPNVRVKVNTE